MGLKSVETSPDFHLSEEGNRHFTNRCVAFGEMIDYGENCKTT